MKREAVGIIMKSHWNSNEKMLNDNEKPLKW